MLKTGGVKQDRCKTANHSRISDCGLESKLKKVENIQISTLEVENVKGS